MASISERLVLRAEVFHDTRHIIGHTTELSPTYVLIRTDEELAVGDAVRVRLSFPRLLPPLELEARVTAIDPGLGHGYARGVTLGFDDGTTAHDGVLKLLGSLDDRIVVAPFRILVVEDSPIMRDFLQLGAERFLAGAGNIVVETADTAELALTYLQRETYDLVLADLFLPGDLDGAALVREVRAEQPHLPVIGFSVGGAKAREAFLTAGADLFLDKPVMVKDVFATLERLTVMQARRSA